ncbi:hypothetical protein B7R70_21595 [Yersinia pseudotuberculosis]|nr:hypothetical protein B7R75_20680 [Yersinia pseudotuberculosis]PST77445.1 hypothetical protein B7R70_21595 [Yersinia pseudotuberculosis]
MKRRSADGSVGSPHARVGHCQASNKAKTPCPKRGVFAVCETQKLRVLLITPCQRRGVFAVYETQKLRVVMMIKMVRIR